jgi:outer membrane protein OmpA-like peptidoglycan-associated protein
MKRRLPKRVSNPWVFFGLVAIVATVLVYCSSREHMNERPIIELGSEPRKLPPKAAPVDELPIRDFKKSFFEFNKSALRDEAKKALRETAVWMQKHPKVNLQIEGFCDDRGSEEYNMKLGQRRADAVLEFFVANGVERERLAAISYGRMQGARSDVRAANRRVEIIAIYPTE